MTTPPNYFVDQKRGEVNELKAMLRNPKLSKEPEKMREVIKKVIAYMTLGIDVSRIFSEMIMASSTKDLVQKKMVYHYLCSYAKQKSDLAILAINTLQKDCKDEDPMVRGLALRSLCSLRVENLWEYVDLPIRKGLNDSSPYVRKAAALGAAKLFRLNPPAVKGSDLVDVLYNMLRDRDTEVVANVINALNEILHNEGRMAINQAIITHLLTRIKEFNEWGQCVVLDLVARYNPATEEEMLDIMNLLEDRLKHSNSAVVLATTKVFLNFTKDLPIHTQVYKRLKTPLVTLMGGSTVELGYAVLAHIKLLVERAPHVFDDQYKDFFSRFTDPPCVKELKLSILTLLANEHNMQDVMNELSEYALDLDAPIARAAIRGIGKIAINLPAAADDGVEHLLSFLDMASEHVLSEAVIVLKDVLRKYPARHEEILPSIQKCLKNVEEKEGKVSVIWMIGEYGETIKDAPYLLEPLIDNFTDEPSSEVRLELLSASIKLFFKRPPQMQRMLGKLLAAAIADWNRVDVRDRAILYYRLLHYDPHEAARVVNCPKSSLESYVEPVDKELKEKIFAEFNSLSVMYGTPEERFTKYAGVEETEEEQPRQTEMERRDQEAAQADTQHQQQQQEPIPDDHQEEDLQPPQEVDLLGEMLSGTGLSVVETTTTGAPGAGGERLELAARPAVDAQTFQDSWTSLPVGSEIQLVLRTSNGPQIEATLAQANISTMASGTVGNTIKFYFFARDVLGSLYLVECVCETSSRRVAARIKSNASAPLLQQFATLFEQLIAAAG